jgi:molecular chaperone DnaK
MMKGDDKDAIESRIAKLEEAGQSLYAAAAAGAQPGAEAGGAQSSTQGAQGEDVVDAEFTEVKDDKNA